MGHVHDCIDNAQVVQYIDTKLKTVKERKKWLVITGHYLKYDNSYAQTAGYPISKMGSPKIKFYSKKHDMHISW